MQGTDTLTKKILWKI